MPASKLHTVESGRWPGMDLNVGRVLALTGQGERALVPLRRAANACERLDDPTRTFTALYYLGLAVEQTGDADGARAAYEAVVKAWGKAKPRSTTANLARAALERLGSR
jgi:serine/threonine-protein kinase